MRGRYFVDTFAGDYTELEGFLNQHATHGLSVVKFINLKRENGLKLFVAVVFERKFYEG